MLRFLHFFLQAVPIGSRACILILLVTVLAACVGGAVPEVDGPWPRLDPASAEPETGTVARLPKEWTFYSQPPEMFGVPVLRPSGGTEWDVTGRWTAAAADLSGRQGWLLKRDWYRLTGDVAPWGRVALWGQLPDDWIVGDRMAVPTVTPPWGKPWRTVPYSVGHVLAVPVDGTIALHACPDRACPVLEWPTRAQMVPVTGQLTDGDGRVWYRVEFRQKILWAESDSERLTGSWASRLRRVVTRAAGYRSCEPVVLFPPPPHALCPVDTTGRFLDEFERGYDRLDPVFGRLVRLEDD